MKKVGISQNRKFRENGNIAKSGISQNREAHIRCRMGYSPNMSIILYADDIMLLSPSIITLQKLLSICERELIYLDMTINVKNLAVCESVPDAMCPV